MKKFIPLVLLIVGLVGTSCTHYIYDVHTLQANYDARMTSPEELEMKAKVKIFTSEQDIKGDYELLSFNSYAPFRLLPFAKPYVKRSSKKFYKKAVQIASEEGGNAIIIIAPLHYKVIRLANFNEETAKIEEYRSIIFDTETMDLVASDAVAAMTRGERRKTLSAFENEIEMNVGSLNYLPEVEMVREKLMVYDQYNERQKHSKSSISKFVKKQTKKANKSEKKIKKMIAKNKIDSVFLAHTAICEKQWADFNISHSAPAPKVEEKPAPAPKVEEKPASAPKVEEKPAPAPAPAPAPKVEEDIIIAKKQADSDLSSIEQLVYSTSLLERAKNGEYIQAFDFNRDDYLQAREVELIETLAKQSDMDGNNIWDEEEMRSLRHRLMQVVKYYK